MPDELDPEQVFLTFQGNIDITIGENTSNFDVPLELTLDEIFERIAEETDVEAVILALDLKMQDEDFTLGLISKLIESLAGDHEDEAEKIAEHLKAIKVLLGYDVDELEEEPKKEQEKRNNERADGNDRTDDNL